MDTFKKETVKNYTAFDLNAKCVKNNHKLEKLFNRNARRKNKQKIKKDLTNQ